jgi:hypothetical protein
MVGGYRCVSVVIELVCGDDVHKVEQRREDVPFVLDSQSKKEFLPLQGFVLPSSNFRHGWNNVCSFTG